MYIYIPLIFAVAGKYLHEHRCSPSASSRSTGVLGCTGECVGQSSARPPAATPKMNLFKFNTHCEKYVRIWIQMNEHVMAIPAVFFLLQSSVVVGIKIGQYSGNSLAQP